MIKNKKSIYDDPYEKSGSGILALLFRKVISENKWDQLWKYFVDRYKMKGGTVAKNTVYSYKTAKALSAKNFFMVLLKVLPVEKVTITIELKLLNGDKSLHSLEVDGDMMNLDDEDKEELVQALKVVKSEKGK